MLQGLDDKKSDYPLFLQDYGKLLSHFQSEFAPLNSNQRGDAFAEFTAKLVPHEETGRRFERPQKRQQTYDEGIDLWCQGKDESESLFIQAKYTIPGVDEIDSILSKFEAFESNRTGQIQPRLIPDPEGQALPISCYMIVTASDLKSRILPRFQRSKRSTVDFYKRMKAEDRLVIVDGPSLLPILQETYKKSYLLPSDLQLCSKTPFVHLGNVFVAIIAGSELVRLYNQFGNALFLEDVREYLGPTSGKIKSGPGRQTVNEAIAETLQTTPAQFLARNNGVTFRAGSITPLDESKLKLDDASIVNGCQTTMTIVRNPSKDCFVLAKVVQAEDSWDIAESTNFQNEVDQVVLKLARYIRPQMIRAAANRYSFQFRGSEAASPFAVVDSIYQQEITEEEFRALFLGFFSSSPRNVLAVNYTEVKTDIVDQLFEEGNPDTETILEVLLRINQITRDGAQTVEDQLKGAPDIADLFQRFWKEDKPNYRSLLAIVAVCGCVGRDIYSDPRHPTYQEVIDLLTEMQTIIDTNPDRFLNHYRNAFRAVAIDTIKGQNDRNKMLQQLKSNLQNTNFNNLYLMLQALASTDVPLSDRNELP